VILRPLVPVGPEVDLDDRAALLEWYRTPRPDWLRLNFVASVDGSVTGPDGTSETLTSRSDRRILGVIRELADAVLVGAGSVRSEGYQVPKRAPLVIATRSGDLGGHRIEDLERVVVLGPERARATVAATLGAEFVAVGDHPRDLVSALYGRGWRSVVCEGGPTLAAELLNASLVDELCLTTSPVLGGASLPLLGGPVAQRRLSLAGLLSDDDDLLFARWLVER